MLIIGLMPFLVPRNIEKSTIITQNQTNLNEENLSQDNFFTPKAQDSPSSKIQFNSIEKINRSYSWVGPTNETLSFETPVEYDTFNAEIDLQITGTIEVDVVEDSSSDKVSTVEQAQAFHISDNVSLTGFSIHIPIDKKTIQPHMEIRNNSITGEILHEFDPFIYNNIDGWYEIPIIPYLSLTSGKYFLWMEENSYGSAYNGWHKSEIADNDTETWEFIGTSWQLADYDLTLKVHTSIQYNPEDVEMKINNVPVINTEPGQGFVKILGSISSSNTLLTVSSNESITFSYLIESTFFKTKTLQYDSEFKESYYDWNLTLDSGYLGFPYLDYRINISGIKDSYYDIQVFNNTDVIGYSLISPEVIEFTTEATLIIFQSPNSIDSVILDNYLKLGSNTNINVSAKGIGDIYVFIWDDETLVYQNSSYNVSNQNFQWNLNPNLDANSVVVEIFFNGLNEIGYYSNIINISKESIFWLISIPILIGLVSTLVVGYFIQKEKVKKSILGLMILHDNGAPLAEKISYTMQRSDSALVSGAFIGILSLIKEITGSRLRTIEIEGGYVNLVHGNSFWLLTFIKSNPIWIKKSILKLKDEIQLDFGEEIIDFHGKSLEISLDEIIKKYFNTTIQTEQVSENKSFMNYFAKINKLKKK